MNCTNKICKICNEEKTIEKFKKYRKVCRICDSKINYEKYRDKFKEYYIKDQENRIKYQIAYNNKKNEGKPKKPLGRPRTVNVKPLEKVEE